MATNRFPRGRAEAPHRTMLFGRVLRDVASASSR
ncbi:hypothetical protein EDD27_3466 [Nonomuraea polychroma]|uniref:Uncharacterized protein n=1 Tax=Nonomuraea polychroma TaxID=46176 RepID=A0A438M5C1_9ACTN|nr:hypothetical protein EDD27_3466 [Nonomuraea polychroma]